VQQDPRRALPELRLYEVMPKAGAPQPFIPTIRDLEGSKRWWPRPDLLGCGPNDWHFVIEAEDEVATIRFGNDRLGRSPESDSGFLVRRRIQNGAYGNVAAGAIRSIVSDSPTGLAGVLRVTNPLPATGGVDAESIEEVREYAPRAFTSQRLRAVTADDYARLAEQHPGVARAAARLRWTGAWYEARVAIDPKHEADAPADLLSDVRRHLHRFRLLGHDLRLVAADYVALRLKLTVQAKPGYLAAHVRDAVRRVLTGRSAGEPSTAAPLFGPDQLTFGQPVYVSRIVAAVAAVEGVEDVTVNALQRYGGVDQGEVESGLLRIGPTEVARLDDDPNAPAKGVLDLTVGGGR
jgi:predicted phage baseplate assembly protein